MKDRRIPCLAFSLLLCMAAVAAMLLCDSSAGAQSTTRYVAPGGDCGGASPCYATIQDAVDDADEGDAIKVAQGVYTAPGFQVVYIDKAVTLTGGYTSTNWIDPYPDAQPTVIDAQNVARRRGVYIDGTAVSTITLEGLVIQGGHAQDSGGGGVYIVTGTVELEGLQVRSNEGTGHYYWGGGLHVVSGTVTVSNSLVEENSGGPGGGLRAENGILTLIGNTFRGNKGGGVAVMGGSSTMKGNTFESNSGSGVRLEGANATLTGNTFRDNSAGWGGGGITIYLSTAALTENTFLRNSAAEGGGGVKAWASTITLSGNTFESNSAQHHGGGLAGSSSKVSSHENTFLRNSTGDSGGGVHFDDTSVVSLSGNIFEENSAKDKGGGLSLWRVNAVLAGNIFLGNSAGTYAGGICIQRSTVRAQNNIVANSTAPWEAVYLSDSTLSARHWTLANNGNYALTTDANSTAALTNTIVASHTVAGFWGSGINADHSLFFDTGAPCGGGAQCTNNVAGDPRFVSPETGDYHIREGSAAVDQGVDSGVTSDIDGEQRPSGAGFDIGADELAGEMESHLLYVPLAWQAYPGSSPVTGSVQLEGGLCCAGGLVGQTITVTAAYEAASTLGKVTDMRTEGLKIGGCLDEQVNQQAGWEPFRQEEHFRVRIVSPNFVRYHVAVQFRDSAGYLSPLYCDEVWVEGHVLPLLPRRQPTEP